MYLQEGSGPRVAPTPTPPAHPNTSPDALDRQMALANRASKAQPGGATNAKVPPVALQKAAGSAAPSTTVISGAAASKSTAQRQLVDSVRNARPEHRGVVMAQGLVNLSDRFDDAAAAEAYALLARDDAKVAAQATACFYANESVPQNETTWLDPTRTPKGAQATEDLFAQRKGDVHRLLAQGQSQVGKLDNKTRAAYGAELAKQAHEQRQKTVFEGISNDLVASQSDALQSSFSQEAMRYASTALGEGDETTTRPPWSNYLSMLGQVAKESPSAARDVFQFTQSHALGEAKAGNEALEATLQAFASDNDGNLSMNYSDPRLTPSYLPFIDALLSDKAAQGAFKQEDAMQLFETVCNSAEVNDVSLLEQGDKKGGSRGTAQMAELFGRYASQWSSTRVGGLDGNQVTTLPPLIADEYVGIINDRFDKTFLNFLHEAMFDPKEAGPYRQKLLADSLGFVNDLSTGDAGKGLSNQIRGNLAGNFIGLIDQGYNKYADDVRSSGQSKKAWANFGVDLGFALIPGPAGKAAKILFGQATSVGKLGAKTAIDQLVDIGVNRDIAAGAVEAADKGDLLDAMDKLNLNRQATDRVKAHINQQLKSLAAGDLSLGELLQQVFNDDKVTGNADFSKGVTDGWGQIKDRSSKPGT